MLSPADRNLVARDRELQHLQMLLDPDAFKNLIARTLPAVDASAVTVDYIRYKPMTNCLARFTTAVDGATVTGYAKHYAPSEDDKLAKAQERSTVSLSWGPGRITLEDKRIELVLFPNDNRIARLTQREAILESSEETLHALQYKPERRFVARVDDERGPASVIKMYSRSGYPRARIASRISAGGVIGEVTHERKDLSALVFKWLPGIGLNECLHLPVLDLKKISMAGELLARLHGSDRIRGLPEISAPKMHERLEAYRWYLSFVAPELSGLVDEVVDCIARHWLTMQWPSAVIHGDFYPDHVLFDGHAARLIDLDEAAIGNPAIDIGLFLAHLERNSLRGELDHHQLSVVRDLLLDGYRRARPGELSAGEVELATAYGLLSLAPHYFRSRVPNWIDLTEATLARARNLMLQGARGQGQIRGTGG